jgi:hypothetical protein
MSDSSVDSWYMCDVIISSSRSMNCLLISWPVNSCAVV